MSRSRVVRLPRCWDGDALGLGRRARDAEARLGVRVRRGGVRERELLHRADRRAGRGRAVDVPGDGEAGVRDGTGVGGRLRVSGGGGRREVGTRQGRGGWAETRWMGGDAGGRGWRTRGGGGGDARGGRRREGARTVHVAKVRASIANAVEVQTRRAGAGARARARPARGAARDAIAELDRCATSRSKTARGGNPRAASPAPRRDALRRLRRRRGSPGDEMARARPPCSPRSETTERARSSVQPPARRLSTGTRAARSTAMTRAGVTNRSTSYGPDATSNDACPLKNVTAQQNVKSFPTRCAYVIKS